MYRAFCNSLMFVLVVPFSLNAATITLQASRDTAIHQQSVNVNSGGQSTLSVGFVGGTGAKVLYHFDVSPLNGLYESINSITLRTFVSNNTGISDANSDPGLDVFVHEISAANADWNEGNKVFATSTAGEPTWANRQHSSTPWTGGAGLVTAGVSYATTPLSSVNVPSSIALDDPVNFAFTGDLTALIDSWQTLNPGLVLLAESPTSTDRVFFRSREVVDTLVHPVLEITYSTPVPEPGSCALLGLGSMLLLASRRRNKK